MHAAVQTTFQNILGQGLQGQAYILLEVYAEAERACIEGLAIDPASKDIQQLLDIAQRHLAGSQVSSPESPVSATTPRLKR